MMSFTTSYTLCKAILSYRRLAVDLVSLLPEAVRLDVNLSFNQCWHLRLITLVASYLAFLPLILIVNVILYYQLASCYYVCVCVCVCTRAVHVHVCVHISFSCVCFEGTHVGQTLITLLTMLCSELPAT